MELVVVLTADETAKVNMGDEEFISEVEFFIRLNKVKQVLGRDDEMDSLYTLTL